MNSFTYLLAVLLYLTGIAVAKGFWATTAAIFVPFWSWYLVVEAVLLKLNILG